ncbi:esterase-like activity of phytase family protein [Hyella patelloides]|nr:esterase-like activity of phytase family protein [Hyella patelloides]
MLTKLGDLGSAEALRDRFYSKIPLFFIFGVFFFFITACSPPPQVSAQERMFRNISLEFLDAYEIPKAQFQDTVVGGLSAITYDREQNCYYAISDDRSSKAPARFYTLKLDIKQSDNQKITIDNVKIDKVTFLTDETGQQYPAGTIDGEGIALSPRRTLFISSEGDPTNNVIPFIGEFSLETGQKILDVAIPQRYLAEAEKTKGIRENLAFESLTVNQTGLLKKDPFRLFTATESALNQDLSEAESARIRFLHYVINPIGNPILVAEHLYLLEPANTETISNGLTELLALEKEGYFLSLERTFGFTGAGAKIFQVVVGNATDTSTFDNLKEVSSVQSLRKNLVLDLQDLDIYLDNLEGMTVGSRLPDGTRSLIVMSDDNFNDEQVTQLLLFRLSS